jgi:membrane protein required for colicin V production
VLSTDILLLIPVVLGAHNGFKRGLLVEIIGIVALVFAIIFGFRFLGSGMEVISGLTGLNIGGTLIPYLSFLFIFFPTIFFINKLGWAFRRALRLTILGTMDGMAGAVLGAILWFFGLSTLLWIAAAVGIGFPEKYTSESEIYPYLETFAPNLINKFREILPSAGELIDTFKHLREQSLQQDQV